MRALVDSGQWSGGLRGFGQGAGSRARSLIQHRSCSSRVSPRRAPLRAADVDDLGRRGIAARGFPWDHAAGERAMLQSLSNGTIQALVLTKSTLQYLTNDVCNVTVLGDEFDLVRRGRDGAQEQGAWQPALRPPCHPPAPPARLPACPHTCGRPHALCRSIRRMPTLEASPTGHCTTASTSC